MAEVTTYPLVRHFRAEPTAHVLRYSKGTPKADGAGLAFWFRPTSAAIVEVPLDDQELPFVFHARSADFQQLTVQGVITFRFRDPQLVAKRIDFSLDLATGSWTEAPLEQVQGVLVQMAQQYVIDELVRIDLRQILADGVAPLRSRIADGLRAEGTLAEMGLEIVAVRVASVAPASEVEKALQQPTREEIQQKADEAAFARRAQAVDKERAISENELGNRIELARRTEQLVAQEGANDRRRAEEEAAARAIAGDATDAEERKAASRKADAVELIETARLQAERERAKINAELGSQVLLALAAQELAGQLGKIEHLTITPELITPMLARLAQSEPGA
jgi:regulator of protease activity HflC (stomatin/prohibitin superfamily)